MCEVTSELDLQVLPATDMQSALRREVAYVACPATHFHFCMSNCWPSYQTFHNTLLNAPQTQNIVQNTLQNMSLSQPKGQQHALV